jgi:hypothetical protein
MPETAWWIRRLPGLKRETWRTHSFEKVRHGPPDSRPAIEIPTTKQLELL